MTRTERDAARIKLLNAITDIFIDYEIGRIEHPTDAMEAIRKAYKEHPLP